MPWGLLRPFLRRQRWSFRHSRYPRGPGSSSTGDPSPRSGGTWDLPTPPTVCRPAWSARGSRGPGPPTGPTSGGLPSSTTRRLPRTHSDWPRKSFCSYSARGTGPRRSGAASPPCMLSGSWTGYRLSAGNASGAWPNRRWLPRGTDPMQAHTSSKSWPRPASHQRIGVSLPPPSCPLAASHGLAKSHQSGGRAFDPSPWPSGVLNATHDGSPVIWGSSLVNGPTGCGKSSLEGRSWSRPRRFRRRAWPACSTAAPTPPTVGIPGAERGPPSSASLACPGGTSAGGAGGRGCGWRTSTRPRRTTSSSTTTSGSLGPPARASGGWTPQSASSGLNRCWPFALTTRSRPACRPPDPSERGGRSSGRRRTTPGTQCSPLQRPTGHRLQRSPPVCGPATPRNPSPRAALPWGIPPHRDHRPPVCEPLAPPNPLLRAALHRDPPAPRSNHLPPPPPPQPRPCPVAPQDCRRQRFCRVQVQQSAKTTPPPPAAVVRGNGGGVQAIAPPTFRKTRSTRC